MSHGRRITVTLIAALALFTLTGAMYDWGELFRGLYLQQLEGYREQRARAEVAEARVEAHEKTIGGLTVQVEELSTAVEPLEAEVARLRERNKELAVLGQVENAKRQIDGLRSTKEALAAEVAVLSAEKSSLSASVTKLHAVAAWLENDCPSDGTGCRAFPVGCTKSMLPAFDCDSLPAGTVNPATVGRGDIVIYAWPQGDCEFPSNPHQSSWFIIHRIVGGNPTGFVLKGDANAGADPCLVPKSAIVARIDYIEYGVWPERVR